MIVLASALRARRTRKVPSLGALVRAFGSVQILDQPPGRYSLGAPPAPVGRDRGPSDPSPSTGTTSGTSAQPG